MGKMKILYSMFEYGCTNDRIAWYLLLNTKVPNWEQAKQVAQEMRNEYDETRKDEKKDDKSAE